MTYRQKKKLFRQELKRINKEHTPDKCDRIKPTNWKREWGPFIKYDADWDWCCFLDLIIYKMERMYADLDIFSDEVRDSLDKKLKTLKEIIDLGKKIQNYDYYVEEHDFCTKHTTKYIIIYEGGDIYDKDKKVLHTVLQVKSEDPQSLHDIMGTSLADEWCKQNGYKEFENCHYAYTSKWDDESNYKEWLKLVKKCCKAEQADNDKFFKLISRNYKGWWW